MAEISNNMLAVLVVSAFVVVLASAFVNFFDTDNLGLAGRATTGDGNISLNIASTLAIAVNSTQQNISLGQCTPRAASSYWCATNDAFICDNTVGNNCTGDTGSAKYIEVNNVGNVDANVNFTITNSCDAAALIGGTGSALTYQTTQCNGTNTSTWTNIPNTGGVGNTFCSNLSYRGPGAVRMYINVTIPYNAAPTGGCGSYNASVFRFTANQI